MCDNACNTSYSKRDLIMGWSSTKHSFAKFDFATDKTASIELNSHEYGGSLNHFKCCRSLSCD